MSNLSDYFGLTPEQLFVGSSNQESWGHRLYAPDGRMAFGFPVQHEKHMVEGMVTLDKTTRGLLVLTFRASTPFYGFKFRYKDEAVKVDTDPFVGVIVRDEAEGTSVSIVDGFLMPVKSGINREQSTILAETLASEANLSRIEKSTRLDLELQNILGNIN